MYKVKIYCNNFDFDNCSNWRANMLYSGDLDKFNVTYYFNSVFDTTDDLTQDIIIIIRPIEMFYEYIKFLKENGIKVIVDYDDVFPLTLVNAKNILSHINEVINIFQISDLIITTNEKMKLYLYNHSFNEKIYILPNVINPNFVSDYKKINTDKVLLGWYGNSGKLPSLLKIKDIILRILNEYENVYLKLYYFDQEIINHFLHPKVIFVPYNFNFDEFQNSINDIDINLCPLNEDYFNLHKSNIGIILPGYKGIPSVASNFGEYKCIGKENVLLCDDDSDWYYNIKLLINNVEKRNIFGSNIKKYVDNNFTFDVWKNKTQNVLYDVLGISTNSISDDGYVIVQIGSNKGNDELTTFINKNKIKIKKGIFVEANPFHISDLKKCYEKHENVVIENLAIKPKKDDDSELEIFFHTNDNPHYEVASVSKDHVASHHNYDYDNIYSFRVPAITLEDLLDKHNIHKIDWLLIDVEGIDAEIIENFNWNKYDINRVDVEHIHFGEKRDQIFELFYSLNYKHVVANDVRYDAAFEKI